MTIQDGSTHREPEVSEETTQAAAHALKVQARGEQLLASGHQPARWQVVKGLESLVALCVRYHQTTLLAAALVEAGGRAGEGDVFGRLFLGPLDEDGHTFSDLLDGRPPRPVRLSDGLILTAPWAHERSERALLRAGPKWRTGTEWRQWPDQTTTQYFPWGLHCVHNGNHSAMSGILWGDGELLATSAYDLGRVLDRVRLSGQGIVREHDGRLVGTSEHWPVLALVGLGKLLRRVNRDA